MKNLSAPTLCNLLGLSVSLLLVVSQMWQEYQYIQTHTGQKTCGLPAMGTLFLGLLLTSSAACLASILAYFIYRAEGRKNWRGLVLLQALAPLYFLLLTLLLWQLGNALLQLVD